MSKSKQIKVWKHTDFLVILGVVSTIFALVALRDSQGVLGKEHQNNQQSGGGENDLPNFQPTTGVFPVITQAITPTIIQENQIITPTEAVVTPIPTEAPVVQPTLSPNSFQTSFGQESSVVQTRIVVVPISEKSVTSSPSVSSPKTSGGIIQTIKQSFGSFGKASPTTVPTPIPTASPIPSGKENSILLNTIRLKYQITSGQVVLSALDQGGNFVSVDETDLKRIEGSSLSKLEKKGITLNLTSDNRFAVSDNGISAITDLPVSVDVESKMLMVSTVDGAKYLTVLPNKALKNIVDLGVVSGVNTAEIPLIDYLSGQVVYKFGGNKVYKMFGLFKVSAPLVVSVSADNGEVINGDQPWLTKVVRLLSI